MNILIAEDEMDIALLYKKVLEARNLQGLEAITITSNGEDCLKRYHDVSQEMISSHTRGIQCLQPPFDVANCSKFTHQSVILLDYMMPQINGMEVANCSKFTSENNICFCARKRNVRRFDQATKTSSRTNAKTVYHKQIN
jgi:CheY-like chemotaxis protein